MRFSISDQRYGVGGTAPLDVTLGAVAADATVAELLDLLASRHPGWSTPPPLDVFDLELDGEPVHGDARIMDLALRAGSVLTLRSATAPSWSSRSDPYHRNDRGSGPPLMALTQIAGPDCGLTVELGRGTFVVGRGAVAGLALGPVRRPALRVEVTAAARASIGTPGESDVDEVRLDGRLVSTGEVAEATGRTVIAVGDTVFRLAPATSGAYRPEPAPEAGADPHGRLPLIRTPRVATPPAPTEVPVPDPPQPAPPLAPQSWLMMFAPLPIGIVMALVFSPFFLIMTAMTPMMGLARWVEGKYRARKDARRMAAETAAAAVRFAANLDGTRAVVAAAAHAAHADLGDLWRRARSGRGLWQVRPGDPDEMRIGVGIGTLPWRPEFGRGGDALRAMPELAAAVADRALLVDVPVFVDLRERSGLGIVGPTGAARRLAATALVDLVARHGPADVDLALLVEPDLLPSWDWVKWLPHLTAGDGAPRVATDAESAVALLSRLVADTAASRGGPAGVGAGRDATPAGATHTVVVVDGDDLLNGQVAALLGRLVRGRGRALVVTSRPERLPSVCRTFVEVGVDGTATLTDAATGERTDGLLVTQAAPAVCAGTARALARWTDPEQAAAAALLPDRARLVDLLLAAAEQDGADPVGGLDAAIGAWWRRGVAGLEATIGVTESGPLSVDLLADGPHGLVVGTTGAGKSELLRTLVASLACRYSPDDLTFLLIDFKGGGAFDACAGLPHSVGLVTDLDEHLAARALRSLRAELRHRERRLREAGVSDLRDYLAPSPPLPRLLIVVDEFATLAVELPGFLSALVDVAQRGRSLGIHLLLATQRPQGVVDGKIRANTNLRVALRVQDDGDSRDVLGTRHAADIDRRRPGRAYVRLGAGEIVAMQAALVSAPASSSTAERIEVAPFHLLPDADATAVAEAEQEATAAPAPTGTDGTRTDLEELLAITMAAAERGGYGTPRLPWLAPLPDEVDAWALPDEDGAAAGGRGAPAPVPLGLVDLPDEQRIDVWRWRPEAGGTLVLGAEPAAAGAAVASACLGLARVRHPDRQKILILDGLACGLGELAGLPHVVAAVGVDDAERLSRVLDRVDAEVTRRRTGAAGGPEILLVIAGWGAVVDGAERAGLADAAQRLERVLRDGASVGVRLLTSAPHDRGLPARVLAQLPTKLCLRMADPSSYAGLGLRARDVPVLRGLRAVDLDTRHELHIGRYGDGTPQALAASVARVAARYPDATPAPTVGVLPEVVPASDVRAVSTAGTTWRLGIGRSYRDLQVASLELAPGMHVVAAGPPGSGRTTALRVLAAAARESAPAATIGVVAADPARWDPADVTELVGSFEELSCWPPQGRGLLLVDGVESMGPGAGTALDRLLPATPAGAHVVVAGRADAFRGMQPWQRTISMSRTGLLLRPGLEDGDILRVRLPRETQPRPVPGRGYLVEAGGFVQVQVAFLPPLRATPDLPAMPSARTMFSGGVR